MIGGSYAEPIKRASQPKWIFTAVAKITGRTKKKKMMQQKQNPTVEEKQNNIADEWEIVQTEETVRLRYGGFE